MLQSMGLQKVGQDWATEQQQYFWNAPNSPDKAKKQSVLYGELRYAPTAQIISCLFTFLSLLIEIMDDLPG